MGDWRTGGEALTKADYDRLEAEGKIRAPLTWGGPRRRSHGTITPRKEERDG